MGLFIGNPGSLSSGGGGHGVGLIDTGIYGVNFAAYAGGANNRVGTRIDDAAGMSWSRSTTTDKGTDDFDGKGPFNVRECVTRWNSSTLKHDIVAYEDEDEWETYKNNTNLNRMIEFPKFYYNRPSKWQFRVSSEQHEGFLPSPMHYRNGIMHDYVYIAKYAVDSSFMSRSGQSPKVTTTLEAFRNGIRGQHMYVIDWPVWCSVTMLMLIKYANLDVQSVVGQGNSNSSGPVVNGAADSVKGKDGGIAAVSSQGSVVTLGIENWYSNLWYFIDGFFKNSRTMMINEDIENITSNPNTSTWAGYSSMSSQVPSSSGSGAWVSDIAFESNYPYSLHPTAVNNSINVGDVYSYNSGGVVLYVGGSYVDDSASGPLAFIDYYGFTISNEIIGFSAFFLS